MKYAVWFGAVSGVRSITNVPAVVSTTACFDAACAWRSYEGPCVSKAARVTTANAAVRRVAPLKRCPTYAGGRRALKRCPTYAGGRRALKRCPTYAGGRRALKRCPTYAGGRRAL